MPAATVNSSAEDPLADGVVVEIARGDCLADRRVGVIDPTAKLLSGGLICRALKYDALAGESSLFCV